jgi:hypothetical protein
MPGKLLQYPDLDLAKIIGIVGIVNGGTDGDTAPEAVTNLGGVSRSTIGQTNGPVPLDSNGRINISYFDATLGETVTITGPSSLNTNQQGSYAITNYDSFRTYTLTASAGSVNRNGNTITYTAPANAGLAGFAINGRQIDITIN